MDYCAAAASPLMLTLEHFAGNFDTSYSYNGENDPVCKFTLDFVTECYRQLLLIQLIPLEGNISLSRKKAAESRILALQAGYDEHAANKIAGNVNRKNN
jgi:hypothetical protein